MASTRRAARRQASCLAAARRIRRRCAPCRCRHRSPRDVASRSSTGPRTGTNTGSTPRSSPCTTRLATSSASWRSAPTSARAGRPRRHWRLRCATTPRCCEPWTCMRSYRSPIIAAASSRPTMPSAASAAIGAMNCWVRTTASSTRVSTRLRSGTRCGPRFPAVPRGAARSATGPRMAASTGSTPSSPRSRTATAGQISTSRSAPTSPPARRPNVNCRASARRWPTSSKAPTSAPGSGMSRPARHASMNAGHSSSVIADDHRRLAPTRASRRSTALAGNGPATLPRRAAGL
jgi:hypothetical protein